MEDILLLLAVAGVPIFVGIVWLLTKRRAAFGAGWALARWAAGEPWRPPFLAVLLGLGALAVVVWGTRLDTPVLGWFFFVALVWFVAGVVGSK